MSEPIQLRTASLILSQHSILAAALLWYPHTCRTVTSKCILEQLDQDQRTVSFLLDIIECHSKSLKMAHSKEGKRTGSFRGNTNANTNEKRKGKKDTTKATKIEIQAKLKTFHRKGQKDPNKKGKKVEEGGW